MQLKARRQAERNEINFFKKYHLTNEKEPEGSFKLNTLLKAFEHSSTDPKETKTDKYTDNRISGHGIPDGAKNTSCIA